MTPATYLAPLLQGLLPTPLAPLDCLDPTPNRTGVDIAITAGVVAGKGDPARGRAFARQILSLIDLNDCWIKRIEIADPGFINIAFAPRFFIDALRQLVPVFTRFSMGAPLPQSTRIPATLRASHMRIAGLLRHAWYTGLDVTPQADFSPLIDSEFDIGLARRVAETNEMAATTALSDSSRHIKMKEFAQAIDNFYYQCRLAASPQPLRDARLALLSIAAGQIEALLFLDDSAFDMRQTGMARLAEARPSSSNEGSTDVSSNDSRTATMNDGAT